jgi:hypothetical protein
MLFGHNTNVVVGNQHYHVQTEDRGVANAVLDTTVYLCGRVVHRRKGNYSDLLPLEPGKESILKQRIDEQHAVVEQELRTGVLKFAETAAGLNPAPTVPELRVELLNSASWVKGKHASLQLRVTDPVGNPSANASIVVRMDGGTAPVNASGTSAVDGTVGVEFEMPALAGTEATLMVEACAGATKGHLRFQLRARPKVPAV